MGTEYYYARDDERVGPVSRRQLRLLVAAGVLGPDDLVWAKPLPDWVEARTIPGLFPADAGAPASVTRPADRMPLSARIEAARRRAGPLVSALGVKLRALAGAARDAGRQAVQYWQSLPARRQRQLGAAGVCRPRPGRGPRGSGYQPPGRRTGNPGGAGGG
ncbi:MAG: DUF4339 domain-containing protein [Gemmataceae bacterium]|nr:DUF4339 domain-containing protein [Gemmataceae bacterium]